jgi:DNA methylase
MRADEGIGRPDRSSAASSKLLLMSPATRPSWFAIAGHLEPIPYHGPSDFRFPESVAQFALERWSKPHQWVLDPFAGFGTTLVVAERLGRHGVGFEVDPRRARFAASRLPDGRVLNIRSEEVPLPPFPPFGLLFTSPPYGSFRSGDRVDDVSTYRSDAQRLFGRFLELLDPAAPIVVEVSQIREGERTRPLVWQLGSALAEILDFREEVVRVNTDDTDAGPGYDHSHILVFAQRPPTARK